MPGHSGGRAGGCHSGAMDVRPQSSHRRYKMGNASERPMIRALAMPHFGQTTVPVVRFVI